MATRLVLDVLFSDPYQLGRQVAEEDVDTNRVAMVIRGGIVVLYLGFDRTAMAGAPRLCRHGLPRRRSRRRIVSHTVVVMAHDHVSRSGRARGKRGARRAASNSALAPNSLPRAIAVRHGP